MSEIVAESRGAENRDASTKDIEFSVTLSQPPASNTDSGANATLAGEEYKASADAVGGAARYALKLLNYFFRLQKLYLRQLL